MPRSAIADRFATFHAVNPGVADELERLAAARLAAGATRLSIAMLFEVLRYRRDLDTVAGSPFKLDNSFRSHYTRLLIDRNPRWAEAFRTRTLIAA